MIIGRFKWDETVVYLTFNSIDHLIFDQDVHGAFKLDVDGMFKLDVYLKFRSTCLGYANGIRINIRQLDVPIIRCRNL